MNLNRRQFCGSTVASVVAGSMSIVGRPLFSADDPGQLPVIDAHTHFYDTTRPQGVPFPSKDDKRLYRPMLPKEFEALTKPFGVVGTIVIEASPWLEDNQWLLDLAEKDPFIVGVVGSLTPGTEDFAAHLKRFTRNSRYRGIRINTKPLNAGLDRPEYVKDLERLAEADLELDVLGGPETLELVDRAAKKLPELRILINHMSNTRIDGKTPPAEWLSGVRAAAKHQNVFMKVSALAHHAAVEGNPPTDPKYYRPHLQGAWDAFGEDRLIYGSDWPVSENRAPYELIFRIVQDFWNDKGVKAARKFFYENSLAIYKWPKRS